MMSCWHKILWVKAQTCITFCDILYHFDWNPFDRNGFGRNEFGRTHVAVLHTYVARTILAETGSAESVPAETPRWNKTRRKLLAAIIVTIAVPECLESGLRVSAVTSWWFFPPYFLIVFKRIF